MPTLEIDGGTLWYEEAGHGPPVVLIHGALVDAGLWDGQWEAFAAKHRVVRYEVPGFARSSLGETPVDYLRRQKDLMDRLGIQSAAIVGLSMGGGIALEFAAAYPDAVSAVVVACSGGDGSDVEPSEGMKLYREREEAMFAAGDIAGAVEEMLRFWTDGPSRSPGDVDPAVRERIRQMSAGIYARGQIDFAAYLDQGFAGRAHEIVAPTLFVLGAEDVPDVEAAARATAASMKDARIVTIDGGAHHLPMEQPDKFNAIVLDFLARAR